MALLLWLLMALVPFVLGKSALRVFYGNQPTQEFDLADKMLTGWLIVIGLAEVAHLGACLLGRSFSDCVKLFGMGIGSCCVLALLVQLVCKRKEKNNAVLQRRAERERVKRILTGKDTKGTQLFGVFFLILVLVQFIYIVTVQSVYLDGDMTLETVNSFLTTDAIYQVNPMTGKAYSLGIPMRLKILCLPTFYAVLCESFRLDAATVVLSVIPSFVLLGSYLAYSTIAKKLFGDSSWKREFFLVLTAILFSAGDYMFGMDGFGIMHSGFRGVSIRAAILIPYTVGLMLRKKYKLVVLCILVEACIVWTLYGVGACAAVAVGMLFVRFMVDLWEKHKGGREESKCKNS